MLFSRSLAKKLGKRGVVSVSLHPGVIYTALGAHLQMEDYGEFGNDNLMFEPENDPEC